MSKEAMKLALEALKNFEKAGLATLKTIDAITALRQALEQPEPEPVIDKSAAIRIANSLGWTPKREPLTDEEIAELWSAQIFHIVDLKLAKDFVRDIEAAHGIKGKA